MLVLNADDAVTAAIEMQIRSKALYEKAARVISHPKVKNTMKHFANCADEYMMVFTVIAFKLRARGLSSAGFDKSYLNFLQALVDTHTLFDEKESGTELVHNTVDFFKFASRATKDTILYLSEMMDLLPAKEVAPVKQCFDMHREQLHQLRCLLEMLLSEDTNASNQRTFTPAPTPNPTPSPYVFSDAKSFSQYASKRSPE